VSDAWVAFGAALGGALAGGVASTVGSVWLHRRQAMRQYRSELFRQRIPHLVAVLARGVLANKRGEFWTASELLKEVNEGATSRAAVLAAKRDVRRLRKISNELKRARDVEAQLAESGHDDPRHPVYQAAVKDETPIVIEARKKAEAYEKWLRRKLG
jgi:hypothetical protein